ncbi:type I restriction enzyme, R subunit [Dyadobacter sp. SG02]|uniref:DEAD/DEAH box helicase family protein n=1 Tax=Dyadobacter sp. SG02 TaxID=1855291 RepID=UPI0008D3008E|nr:DEAD/DEAH box helicase family protein [Dyadobacter sp. SG02]SEI39936.1 type I restriction enzyme, R subunit [Dyadobacter sp. SG02]
MLNSNFFFLNNEWTDHFETAQKAESYALTEPTISAILSRKALEEMVKWLYDHDGALQLPLKEQFNLNDLLREPSFQDSWGKEYGKELHIIKNTGNNAVHRGTKTGTHESLSSVKYLFRFCSGVVRTYSANPYSYRAFDDSLIPTEGKKLSQKVYDQLLDEGKQQSIELARKTAELDEKTEEIERLKRQLQHYEQLSKQNGEVVAPAVLSEKETRKLYIDVLLRQAGWDVEAANVQEFPVTAIDEESGTAKSLKIDYVLWGDDGKPLAIIEAKRTNKEVERGRYQAKNYADAIEKQYGQRPVIYYTNGFDTFFWDDLRYPPRKVFGFLNAEELMRLMVRRHQKSLLREQKINQDIAGRYYQERAIRRVMERFEDENQRKALLVMATGTGKTRVSAAIVDLLAKAQWIKRVLFLADRNALVTQALKNYNEYLPSSTGVDLTKETDQGFARVVFSTYQTIINRIDSDYRNGKRYYGVGHFDLIIIDEAHRSIYDKYGAIFEYFDALYLGLTATPKSETDRDTYAIFNHKPGEPTDAYEYTTAVDDKFLVPIKKVKLELRFPTQGIKYTDLSDEEKMEWERKFYDPATGAVLNEIDGAAINQWLFNQDTVDKMLQSLMEFGHKVEGNEKLGKTIIFARNHRHAEFILKRFGALYPQIHPHFAQVIDNYAANAENLILQFKIKEKYPQIAISVDMLDTGIDVPEIVNLVFFKPVYSAAKFWQMLGRGTRLSADLYGPLMDKEDFYVFDVCRVFEFFDQNPQGIIPSKAKSLSEITFNARAELVHILQTQGSALPESEDFQTSKSLCEILSKQVADLNPNAFEVGLHLRQVEHYASLTSWNSIRDTHVRELAEHIAPLVANEETDEQVKRFDLMMVKLQLAVIRSERSLPNYVEKLQGVARELLRKADNVPTIAKRKETLRQILQPEFWAAAGVLAIEKLRLEIRQLAKLLDISSGKEIFYTNFEDQLIAPVQFEDYTGSFGNYNNHYSKLRKIILDNVNHMTINRLHNNQPITAAELNELDRMLFEQSGCQTQDAFKKALGDKPIGIFVRSILGLDKVAVQEAFSEFLSNGPLNSTQIEFVNDIIKLLTKNGTIDTNMLFQQPFTKFHESGVAGVFDLNARRIIEIVEDTNRKAIAG